MKIIKIMSHLTVILDNNNVLTNTKCDDKLYNEVLKLQDDEKAIYNLLNPVEATIKKDIEKAENDRNIAQNCDLLEVKGDCITMPSVSNLILPQSLVECIIDAQGNKELLQAYKNFWTLCSQNPNEKARTNLFWFLKKYGMTISKSGLFIAYRNVDIKSESEKIPKDEVAFITDKYHHVKTVWKKSPSKVFLTRDKNNKLTLSKDRTEETLQEAYNNLSTTESEIVYTDNRTHKMEIKIGKAVTLDRNLCDEDQEQTCSSGLHVAGKDWIQRNYFGSTQLMVLVNPKDVVAVPPKDSYGKMRTCSYFPIKVYNQEQDLTDLKESFLDGFEDDFFNQLTYDSEINEAQSFDKSIVIPHLPQKEKELLESNMDTIKKQIKDRLITNESS